MKLNVNRSLGLILSLLMLNNGLPKVLFDTVLLDMKKTIERRNEQ